MYKKALVLCILFNFLVYNNAHAQPLNDKPENQASFHQADTTVPASSQGAYENAIALARAHQYLPALDLFAALAAQPDAAPDVLFDYAAVASWAQEYQIAIQLYENRILPLHLPIPDYVKNNVAGAYYQQGLFQEAQQLYHEAGTAGNEQSSLWEAQSWLQLGNETAAKQIYSDLLQKDPENSTVYCIRAQLWLKANDPVSAENDIAAALHILKEQGYSESSPQVQQVRSEMAAHFIRSDNYLYAISLLKPAISDNTATINMQCDYILALSLNGEYKNAIREGKRLWNDYGKVPIYGRKALAGAYFHTGQMDKAISLYRSIETEGGGQFTPGDKQSLAYAYLIDGKIQTGLALYQQLIAESISQADQCTSDADALLLLGRYHGGRQLYQLIINTYPGNSIFRQRFAAALNASGLLRESYIQYKALDQFPQNRLESNIGLANTALSTGAYHEAHLAVAYLDKHYPDSPAAAKASSRFQQRPLGYSENHYQSTADYKGNTLKIAEIWGEQRLSDHFSLLAGRADKKVADDDGKNTLRTNSLGVRYLDMKQMLQLWLDQNRSSGTYSGYRFLSSYSFGENSSLDVSLNRVPVEDSQTLPLHLMSTEYGLTLNRRLGLKDFFSLHAGRDFYSDSNRASRYGLTWTHTMLARETKTMDWSVYYNHLAFAKQALNEIDTEYESPKTRKAYGLQLQNHWDYSKHYWEGTWGLEWGHDYDEPTDFSPSLRLEYGYQFSPNHTLVLEAEYGLRSGYSTNTGGNLQFGYRQFSINYRINW